MVDDKEQIDDASFDRVMTLAYAFEENRKREQKVPWEEVKPEIEKLSDRELEVLLGLLHTKGDSDIMPGTPD